MAKAVQKRKTRSTLTAAVAIDRIDKMVPMIVQNVETAIALESALEVGNDVIGELRGSGDPLNFYGAHCYNVIRFALTQSWALTLAKLFDPEEVLPRKKKGVRVKRKDRPRHPNDTNTVSIPLFVRLLRQTRCQSALSQRARD
jgi:hypothetical protein